MIGGSFTRVLSFLENHRRPKVVCFAPVFNASRFVCIRFASSLHILSVSYENRYRSIKLTPRVRAGFRRNRVDAIVWSSPTVEYIVRYDKLFFSAHVYNFANYF